MTSDIPRVGGVCINLQHKIDRLRQSLAFRAYEEVRAAVMTMMDEALNIGDMPSRYWQEEMDGFDYMFDASPLIIAKLREHCYHITGIKSYEYRQHHSHAAPPFAAKLAALRAQDPRGLFIPEALDLGGFGHDINGQLVNIDTLKFYESLIAMERAGLLAELRLSRNVVVEVGGGYGGFAYQLKKLIPNTTYIIVDLPPTIVFSGTYLRSMYPEAKCFLYGRDPVENLKDRLLEYDFVFLPYYAFHRVGLQKVDLGINMVSFQEMTTEQVSSYLKRFIELGCPRFYSHNRDRSKHNSELSSVGVLLKRCYRLEEIEVLPIPYTTLVFPGKQPKFRIPKTLNPRRFARELVINLISGSAASRKSKKYSNLDYRHLVGRDMRSSVF